MYADLTPTTNLLQQSADLLRRSLVLVLIAVSLSANFVAVVFLA